MKYGVYFAYWTREWVVDYLPFVKKVASLGFDVLELSGAGLLNMTDQELAALKEEAEREGIMLTACHGLPKELAVDSPDEAIRRAGIDTGKRLLDKMYAAGIKNLSGIMYSYWPHDFSLPYNREESWQIGVNSVRELADYGANLGITISLEATNRYESALFNTAAEAVKYVRDVDRPNVKVHLDSFHMNIEEENIGDAIRYTGDLLGHLHIGENHREVPGRGHIPWAEIGEALRDIGYEGTVVMEPFVRKGGTVGKEIRVWRSLCETGTESELDEKVSKSLIYLKAQFEK